MPQVDPKFDNLAIALLNRAFALERNMDKLVRDVFITISRRVITHTPLWSGQAKLNWTASVGARKPAQRFVNVARTNISIKGGKSSGGNQGHRGNISFDPTIAATANVTAIRGMLTVATRYYDPIRPSRKLPPVKSGRSRSLPSRSRRGKKPPKLFLSNSLDYASKLWSGSWPSNPRTLEQEVQAGVSVIRRFAGTMLELR